MDSCLYHDKNLIQQPVRLPLQREDVGLDLNEELAGPEEIDEALLVAGFLDGVLEEGPVAAMVDAEDGEEFGLEGLAVAFFVDFALPAVGKGLGACFDFVPREAWHPSPVLPLGSR